jgi:hypothetical protein
MPFVIRSRIRVVDSEQRTCRDGKAVLIVMSARHRRPLVEVVVGNGWTVHP